MCRGITFDYLSSLNVELYLGLADRVDKSSLDTARGEDMPPTPIMSPMSDLLASSVLSSARLLARLELFPAFLESKFDSGKLKSKFDHLKTEKHLQRQ